MGRNDIEAMPRVKVTVDNASNPVTFEEGVLEKAGIGFDESLKVRDSPAICWLKLPMVTAL